MTSQSWWKSAVFYQIYPRSFADGNGDGIGDLWGALDKLDYLQWLGIDAVWISPHYPSPQADIGYDVSDYADVNPEYGDLALFDRFLAEAHARGIRVLVDLVINHSSDQHPWFLESRSSADNPKADWYVWHPGVIGPDGERQPPNNWISPFGGPAWTWDDARGEYFYHYFLAEQPDLNWHNPDLAAAMWDAVRFWLDRGVDGFRIDALGTIFEDPEMADHTSPHTLAELIDLRYEPGTIPGDPGELWDALAGGQRDLPGVHDVMKALRRVLEEYDDRVLVGETGELSYHGDGTDELQLVFNFPLADVRELTPEFVRTNQRKRLPLIPEGAWPCNTFNNHDRDRIRSKLDDDGDGEGWAKVTGSIALLLKGTPSLYMGEEIGMENLYLDRPGDLVDPIGIWFHGALIEERGASAELAMERAARFSRDRCRTPMQWSSAANAGFSPDGATPWLPVHPNHADGVTVADQRADPESVLHHYRDLIHLRREHPPLLLGDQQLLEEDHETVLAFSRSLDGAEIVVAVNLSPAEQTISLGHLTQLHGEATSDAVGEWTLPPFGTFVGTAG